jgi:hypothetical protein
MFRGLSSRRISSKIQFCLVCGFVCVCLCVYMCKHVSICMFVFFTSSKTFYAAYLVCLLQLKPWHLQSSSHLLILTSTHNEHIHMIWSNILMNIFMQVFGVCTSYNYITHLSTYTPTRSRANHRLVGGTKKHHRVGVFAFFWHSRSQKTP